MFLLKLQNKPAVSTSFTMSLVSGSIPLMLLQLMIVVIMSDMSNYTLKDHLNQDTAKVDLSMKQYVFMPMETF